MNNIPKMGVRSLLLGAAVSMFLLVGCGRTEIATAAQVAAVQPAAQKGSLIAYTVLNDGLFIADEKGNHDQRIKAGDANTQTTNLRWSPNGERVLYTWRGMDSNGAEINKLCSITPDGTNERCYAESREARFYAPVWSPDGTAVVYVAVFFSAFERNGIYRSTADGSSNRRLIAGANEYTRLAWSPDGSQIAFSLYQANKLALFTMDPDGANATSITSGYDVYSFSWSPDSQSLAFNSLEAAFVLARKGGAPRKLAVKPAAKDALITWSPDGKRIALDAESKGSKGRIKLRNIVVVDLSSGASPDAAPLAALTNDTAQNSVFGWSPDGLHLVFVSTRDGKPKTYIMDVDGKNPRLLSKNEQVREVTWQP